MVTGVAEHTCQQFEYAAVIPDDQGVAFLLRCPACGREEAARLDADGHQRAEITIRIDGTG